MGDCYIVRRGGAGGGSAKLPEFTYTGDYQIIQDDKKNWRIKFLTSGTLRFTKLYGNTIDVFCVSGGMGGNYGGNAGGGGGGGGPTATAFNVVVQENVNYDIIVGAGGAGAVGTSPYLGTVGGFSSAFGTQSKQAARPDGLGSGGSGGSGGGGYGYWGGSDGGNGRSNTTSYPGGSGQGSTTREFEAKVTNVYIVGSTPYAFDWLSLTDGGIALTPTMGVIYGIVDNGTADGRDACGAYWYKDYIWDGEKYVETDVARVYAGGGGGSLKSGGNTNFGGAGGGGYGRFYRPTGGSAADVAASGEPNTGGGGGGTFTLTGGSGGSGIVVIRNHREVES